MSERHSMEPNERIKTAATAAMSAAKSQAVGGAGENPSPTMVDAQSVEAIIADWPKRPHLLLPSQSRLPRS